MKPLRKPWSNVNIYIWKITILRMQVKLYTHVPFNAKPLKGRSKTEWRIFWLQNSCYSTCLYNVPVEYYYFFIKGKVQKQLSRYQSCLLGVWSKGQIECHAQVCKTLVSSWKNMGKIYTIKACIPYRSLRRYKSSHWENR